MLRGSNRQFPMKLLCLSVILPLFLLIFTPQTNANLRKDKKSLLQFATLVPHGPKLNWKYSTRVCTSWVGITCSSDKSSVTSLRLPGVGLKGPIPNNTLGRLDKLVLLSLRSNSLNGTLPSDVLSLPSLQYVFLEHNDFSGNIPSLSSQLISIDLSFNSFEGTIPVSLQNLTQLTRLYLQNNSLTGSISMLKFSSLTDLNLSNNHLNGSIPLALRRFPNSSFVGNSGLCGPPLSQCPRPPAPISAPSPSPTPSSVYLPPLPSPDIHRKQSSKKKLSKWAIVAISVGVLVALMVVILMLCGLKKKNREGASNNVFKGKGFTGGRAEKPREDQFGSGVQEAEKNNLVFFEGCSFNFDLEDLLRASAEVLGKGSYGTTYKATMEDGTMVVVKRLKEVVVGKREFEQQMEMIGKFGGHPNVVPLRAYYYSKDEKLLVYQYMSTGNLFARLHGSKDEDKPVLDWEARVKILHGVAKGIAHIHSAVVGNRFIHGNIKSSNILLSEDLNGCVSDSGLAPIMNFPPIPPRTTGYRAPENIETRKNTQKSDIYSFGVLILELLTGKAPVQYTSGGDDMVDLPRWVNSVLREEWTAEVFDLELMKSVNIEEEKLVQMLQVGMACVLKAPDMRPDMGEVVMIIEEIKQLGSADKSSESEPKASLDA